MACIIRRKYKAIVNGKRVTKRCDNYVIEYRDADRKCRRVTLRNSANQLVTDKAVAQAMLTDWQRATERGDVGLSDPFKATRGRPLAEHLADFVADLTAKGRSHVYIINVRRRFNILMAECSWSTLRDVEPNSFMRWRSSESKLPPRWLKREKKTDRVSAETLNQYLDTARAFLNWCIATKRYPVNPLADVSKVEGPEKRKRRALKDAEVTALLAIAPEDRKIVYRVGIAVGLRRAELVALEWGDLRLNAIRPYVQLRGETTKGKRDDKLPLPSTLADDLRKLRRVQAGDGEPVFRRVPSIFLWRVDLKAAKIPYIDDQGKAADFHAGTRRTLCTRNHLSGMPLAQNMLMMRHTDPKLTMRTYADQDQIGDAAALNALPELLPAVTPPTPALVIAAG